MLIAVVAAAAVWVPIVAVALSKSGGPRLPVVLLGGLSAVIVFTPQTGATPLVSVAGFNIFPMDVIAVVGIVAAVCNGPALARNLRGNGLRIGVVVLMIAASLVLGYAQHSSASVIDASGYIFLIGVAMYVLSLDRALARRLVEKWLLLTGAALVMLCLYNVALHGVGSANTGVVLPDGSFVSSRPLNAEEAVVLGAALIVAFMRWGQQRGSGWRVLLFSAALLVAQQRDVWLSTGIALVVLAWKVKLKHPLRIGYFLVATAVAAVTLTATTGTGQRLAHSLGMSLGSASVKTGTGGARWLDSKVLIAQAWRSGHIWFGQPFGSGYLRAVNGVFETYSPHNGYTVTLLRIGLIGLIFVVVILLGTLFRGRRGAFGELQVAMALYFIVFSLGYSFPYQLAPVLGLLLFTAPSGEANTETAREVVEGESREELRPTTVTA